MSDSNNSGLFVTFEGIDGSGKSTQLKRCAEALQKNGQRVIETRNPGGTPFGQKLRDILLHYPGDVSPISELLLFMADRTQHMNEVVFPALKQNQIVLCDRHIDSSVAYQGYGRGLDITEIHRLNDLAIQGRQPDLTLLFDGDPAILSQRVSKRGQADRLEGEALDFYQRVRDGFLALAEQNPDRFVVLNAETDLETLHQHVIHVLDARLLCKKL